MSEMEPSPRQTFLPGTFCWADLGTPDQEGAGRFYTALFDWTIHDSPMGDGTSYTMLRRAGRDVAALYQQAQDGHPPAWLDYVSVESVDRSAERAAALGATLLMEPFDVFTSGRMVLLRDPGGATVALWEAREHPGAGLVDAPGGLCWFELMTRDPERAREFYTSLLGWDTEEMEIGGGAYTVFRLGGNPVAGMMRLPEDAEAPPHWLSYLATADADATAAAARELGGAVLVPPTDVPGIGRFSILQDPQGATFGVLGPEGG